MTAGVDPVTGERCRFRSAILPPWARRSPKVTEVLPLMYLHGMSTGDFAPALGEFFGSEAGLSASVAEVIEDKKRGLVAKIAREGTENDEKLAEILGRFTVAWDWA